MSRISRTDLGDLNTFRAIARCGGFRRAALELDVSPSAVSHALRSLETRLGVRLCNRSNRTITLTDAGASLLDRLEAGFGSIELGLEEVNRFRGKPMGRLRLNVLTDAARLVLSRVLADYVSAFPDVQLEIVVQDDFVDIVAAGFDAGIRFGGRVPEDMIAVPLGREPRWILVASPRYLDQAPLLESPSDLAQHRCIGLRIGTGALYKWELGSGDQELSVDEDWAIIVNETELAIEIAEAGGGIAYCQEGRVAKQIVNGSLKEVLPAWSSVGPTLNIYYPSRRQMPEALRALIGMIRNRDRDDRSA
ncbi:LysR family transcriptional regulator [Pararhizobium arenae]|uniref:LysR family transcriptional regulator n=1 Tax=Pararhizobium arenae TaxID=1856850 RepID=UPI00094ABD1A|nr:LysR family transcriptional regulator [Pararhizobium arenae]